MVEHRTTNLESAIKIYPPLVIFRHNINSCMSCIDWLTVHLLYMSSINKKIHKWLVATIKKRMVLSRKELTIYSFFPVKNFATIRLHQM